jgi:endonuclease/exonuclease/phosphatase family metal-dependent hydrolase
MRTLLRHGFKLISLLVAALTLLAYLAPFVDPAVFKWLTFFGTAFPWLLLANVGLLLLWTWRRNRFALYHLGLIVLGWNHVTGFIGTDFKKNHIPENSVSIATHNLGTLWRGRHVSDALREKTASEYAQFLKENGFPDILCMQETGPKFYTLIAEKMGYKYTFNKQKGTAILSRYPIEDSGDVPFGKTLNSSLWVDVRIGSQLLRVYNVHLQSNRVTEDTEKVLEEVEQKRRDIWDDVGNVLGKVGRATGVRSQQAQKLREHMVECPHPLILCGDLNDTPSSYVYHRLSAGLTDTFREKGLGFGTTYGGVVPLLRIDYILTDPLIVAHACRPVRTGKFSDHYPVFAEIGLE